ncbi:hypothetical protein [Sulfurimonas sp.]|uniref:hypothetical protein n=1 Tax=Sulfurimonas sp. TaxID=2022749 RepID=UPI002AB0751C|nr:hypothetical protein [Sulfurimonas sp.]
MNKQHFGELIKNLIYNKVYQFLFALFISLIIIFGAYTIYISKIIQNKKAIENSIKTTNLAEIKKQIKKSQEKKQGLIAQYKEQQVIFKKLEGKIYQTHYPIITNILKKINAYAFNIHDYKLDKDFKKMDVTLEGSYQNLIRFIDFLGTIPAKVVVSQYKITLSKEKMMVISLTIEVSPIRI